MYNTQKAMKQTGLAWLTLSVPVHHYAIDLIQQALCRHAKSWSFSSTKIQQMELAVEEAITTILKLIHGEDFILGTDMPSVGYFDIKMSVIHNILQLRITDYDLPYDLSMLPIFSPQHLEEDQEGEGLSVFLLHQMVDQLKVHPPGIHGQSLDLEWYLEHEQLNIPEQNLKTARPSKIHQASDVVIRAFDSEDAIYLARLMHQNYGYSYVNPDLYIAEKICQRSQDGRLSSNVAILEGDLIGHCALMKSSPDDITVELGAAVVSPEKQGLGIFNRLWQSLEDLLPTRQEQLVCVHAVTCHAFTQKTVLRHNYIITALMLAYTPTTIHFKSIQDQKTEERGAVFYCCKLLQPMQPLDVYVTSEDYPWVNLMAQQLHMPLNYKQEDTFGWSEEKAIQLHHTIEPSLNIAYLHCEGWGTEAELRLNKQLKYLCRERIDMIYAVVDLSQSYAIALVKILKGLGFIRGGFTPFMPYPASLLLQYVNNQNLTEDIVHAVGDNAMYVRTEVFKDYHRQELIDIDF